MVDLEVMSGAEARVRGHESLERWGAERRVERWGWLRFAGRSRRMVVEKAWRGGGGELSSRTESELVAVVSTSARR